MNPMYEVQGVDRETLLEDWLKTVKDYGITLPDRELVSAPFDSLEGQEYFRARACPRKFRVRQPIENSTGRRAPAAVK